MNTSTAARYDVKLKSTGPVRVAAIQGVVPNVAQLGDTFDSLFGKLEEYVERNGKATGPYMAIYHDAGTGPRMIDMHVELAIPSRVSQLAMSRCAFTIYQALRP